MKWREWFKRAEPAPPAVPEVPNAQAVPCDCGHTSSRYATSLKTGRKVCLSCYHKQGGR